MAKATQSGVSDDFAMPVPLYLDFGKGWTRAGRITLVGNTTYAFEVPLPRRPQRATFNALNDVLFLKNEAVAVK